MFGKWGLFVLATLASAAVLTSSAGAVNQGSAGPDLSTRAGVVSYLASLGVDARGIVVQRGAHNYAGPNCPGKGWTCTTAKRVLQITTGHKDANKFVCAGNDGPGSSSGPGDCEIFQFASGSASNSARCAEQASGSTVDQNCSITQQINGGGTGSNDAQIDQQVGTSDGSTQFAHQYGGIRQTSSSGANTAQINQGLTQSSKVIDATGLQQQNAHQEAAVRQDSGTGDNNAQVQQSQSLKADASRNGTINQLQNTDGDVNSNAGVDQFSSGGGRNNAQVNQDNWYNAHVGKADTALQQQGASGVSGENVFFEQDSSGLSTIQSRQKEHQDLHAENVTNLTQNQFGPQWADPNQLSNPNDKWSIDQDSNQNASNPSDQEDEQFALCSTTGNCTVSEHIHQGNLTQNNSCSGSSCDSSNDIITQGGETSQNNCNALPFTESSCQTTGAPDPPPPPNGD